MLSEVIKNNEEINRMIIRIMQKRREEGKSFEVVTDKGVEIEEDVKKIFLAETEKCLLTYEAEFSPYQAVGKRDEVTLTKPKDTPDCYGGIKGLQITENMQESMKRLYAFLDEFKYTIEDGKVSFSTEQRNPNEMREYDPSVKICDDYKYVGSTKGQLDFIAYLETIKAIDMDWVMGPLAHEAMHTFGAIGGNHVMMEGATEEFTREICEKHHIMLSPTSHTQEAEFVRKLEMVVGRDKIIDASFFINNLNQFRNIGLQEIITECPDMEMDKLEYIFNISRFDKDKLEDDDRRKLEAFKEKYPTAVEKITKLVNEYQDKNYNERYKDVEKEFEEKLHLTPGSFKNYIEVFEGIYALTTYGKNKLNVDFSKDIYTKKFSEIDFSKLNWSKSEGKFLEDIQPKILEISENNGFEITSFEDLMKPINEYIKGKTLEVDNEPKDYTELLEHQNEELAALREICIKIGIPFENKEQGILMSTEEAINESTRIGKVNEQAQTMRAKQQERMNPDIEKDSNYKSLD